MTMGSINQNHVLGRSESNSNERARWMPLHRGVTSRSDSVTLGRSEQYREGTFSRNSAGVTANLGASPCDPPNCRHSCRSNIDFRPSGHFHDRMPVHDEHTAGAPRAVNRSQGPNQRRGVIQSACSCGGHGRDRCEESECQVVEENRYHRGASIPDIQAGHVHSHPVDDDCGCCCLSQPKTHLRRGEGGDSIDDRKPGAPASPCFPSPEYFTRRPTANGFMSKPSSTSRKATTIASRTDSTSVPNILVPPQVSKDQVILYGWFLKRPTSGSNTPACSTVPQVAIGGYKSAGMVESEYYESGPVVQRLERWRLRTRDGVDVGIMGMINVAKSVENGFPIALAQCFMIGFPSSWIYMISNFCPEAPKGCSPDPSLSSPSPSNTPRQTQETMEYGREVPLTRVSLEADPVRTVLSSPLFRSPEDARFRSLHRLSSTNNVPLRSGIVSDATSVPQSNNSQDMDKSRNDRDLRYGACNSGNHSGLCESKPAMSRESPIAEDVPGAAREQRASLGDGLPGSGNPAVAKEESCREGGVAVVNAPGTSPNEQAQTNMDRGQFLGDGKSKGREDETRNGASDEVNALQDDGVVRTLCKECTCATVCDDSKMTCPSSSGEVGLDPARSSAGDSQDRESKADVHAKNSSTEELSNRGDEIAKQCELVSEEMSESTRKRPFQELNPEEEVGRQTEVICGTSSSSRIRTRSSIGGRTGGVLPDTLTSGLMQDPIPCTPLQESKKRPRTETPCLYKEARDEAVLDYSAAEPVLQAGGAGQVQEDTMRDVICNVTGVVTARAEDLSTAGHENRERQETSAGCAVHSDQIHVSVEESLDFGVEPIVSPSPNACADEIIVATKDFIGDASETRRRLKKVEGYAPPCGEPDMSVEEYVDGEAEPKDGAPPENPELPVKVTRRTRRRVAVISPSSQSNELEAAPGVDEICVVGSVGIGKGSEELGQELEDVPETENLCTEEAKDVPTELPVKVTRRTRRRVISPSSQSNDELKAAPGVDEICVVGSIGIAKESEELGQELEDVPETENLCTEEAKDVPTTGRRKYQRKSKVRYYKSRRRKYTRKASYAAEESLDHNSNPDSTGLRAEEPNTEKQKDSQDSKAIGRGKCSEVETDDSSENTKKEIPAPVRQGNQEPNTEKQKDSQGSKAIGRGKCSEVETDDSSENTKKEVPAPVRQRNKHRATRNYYKPRRRKSYGRDNQSIGDEPGDGGGGESRRDPEERNNVITPSKRRGNVADVSSRPSIKSSSDRCVPEIPSKQGAEKDRSQGKRIKPKTSIVPPPPPSPRVIDKSKVPEAFGLKRSRHGRVLVPRLATWRSQSIKYDMDGSIIAIEEGFQGAKEESGTGCYNFRPPSDKDAVSMQRKLRKAAELV